MGAYVHGQETAVKRYLLKHKCPFVINESVILGVCATVRTTRKGQSNSNEQQGKKP